jgi:phenylalanyl-tRNA synthetase beta chain
MNILTKWLRHYLPTLSVTDRQLADDLTLRGIAVEGVHDLGPNNGHLFEMDITTNRVDAMNHYGIAREAATIYNLPLTPLIADSTGKKSDVVILTPSEPRGKDPRISSGSPQNAEATFPITIEAKDLCGRFTAQILRNITIAPSTGKIAEYFTLLTHKQISNAVDASNFTLLGMGHPTHAFDLDKIEGGIIVRLAHKGEKLKLLDGTERILEPDDLVVADHKKALALAGVMGGYDSMITAETRNILVEAAWFSPAAVRRSSRRHGLHTDASHRFERGADINAAPIANALVSKLILEHGGHAEGALIDILIPEIAARTANRPPITLSAQQVQRHLGTTLDDKPGESALTPTLIHQYLTALGCTLTATEFKRASNVFPEGAGGFSPLDSDPHRRGFSPGSSSVQDTTFKVHLPSWRLDLEREIDLIEEVARVYGYNRFANTLPTPLPITAHPTAAKEAAIRTRLLALGYSESVSTTFASESDADLFAEKGKRTVPLENPLSEEASLLRPSLIPGMATMLAHNLNRDVKEVRLFEQGQIFTGIIPADASFIAEVIETPQLSLGLTGSFADTRIHTAAEAPIFELKGAIESLLSLFDLPRRKEVSSRPERSEVEGPAVSFTTEAPAWLQPGRSATALLNNHPIAHFGELAQSQHEARKLRQSIYLAQIDLAALYELPLKRVTAREISRYQAVERDFSVVFPNNIHWQTIVDAIHALAIEELRSITPAEVWRNEKKYPGVYSLLVRTVFQSLDRTLRDDELTQWQSQIITTLTTLGGTVRAAATE